MQRPYDKNLQNSWYKAYLVDTGVLETAEKGNGYNDKYDHAYNYCSTGQIYIENKTEAVDYAKCPYEAEVNVTLTDNDEIKKINDEYRNINNPTDVLSFPMLNFALPGDFDGISDELENDVEDYFNPDSGELMLGDIVVSVEKVVEQAEKYGHSQERELAFLVAHSMMHLFGYDHMEPDEAAVMESKQKEILDNLGITRWIISVEDVNSEKKA